MAERGFNRNHRTGEVTIMVSDPWDAEALGLSYSENFPAALTTLLAKSPHAKIAIAGKEIMQSRFTSPDHISATFAIEELRRVKTEAELVRIRQAAELSDRGYQHFASIAEPGMTEYELVAEVEIVVDDIAPQARKTNQALVQGPDLLA